ncbi:MAG TPA: tRNA (adenosine(37)-N6)-threonylcarbamoyltransferase complex ATPase subunit type 1 TsaE [Burkholderiales bacterium]|nr:tRNA (adenosine(37)-N6)-threonylcarbamoyltransferase complex ATPase subunit type 1 TsaE [Burkholderiales bacterium]
MSDDGMQLFLADESATLGFGRRLSAIVEPGLLIALRGDLGAGKTTLARGVLRGLGYDGRVKSPTYTLVELYELSRLNLYHFDFYRFNDPRELGDAGFREAFNGNAVCIVEWPERASDFLPVPDIDIGLKVERGGRSVLLAAETEKGKLCLTRLPF